ncbi:MAG: hypothetical protein AAB709_00970 [Patescibacteria group bacterium]
MQRALIISISVLVIIGVIVGAYFYFFTGSASVTVAPRGASLPIAGQGTSGANEITPLTPNPNPSAPVTVSGRLVQISQGPVVPGIAVVDIKAINASSSPEVSVNYIERESGNVFSYLTRAKTLTRINNKTLPGIQSAQWLPDGSAAFVRYLSGADFSTINTYALAATSTSGFFLPQNLSSISVSSTGLLTIASGVNGSAVSLGRIDGTRSSTIFTTPLTALRVSFAGKNQYLAFSKPSAALSGDAFLVDSTGHFSRIAGPRNGLVALASPSGKWVLVSYVQGTTMQMELINAATQLSITLPVATIADKCVWTADGESIYCGVPQNPDVSRAYPDDWYQGAVQFSDRIWKIQVAGRYAQLVLDFSQSAEGNLDAEALAINPVGTVLVFVNKNDGSLWSYAL